MEFPTAVRVRFQLSARGVMVQANALAASLDSSYMGARRYTGRLTVVTVVPPSKGDSCVLTPIIVGQLEHVSKRVCAFYWWYPDEEPLDPGLRFEKWDA